MTGRNQFFVMRPSSASRRHVDEHLLPLVSKSAHVRGITFGPVELAALEEQDALCRLLAVDESTDLNKHTALRAYIREGEAEGHPHGLSVGDPEAVVGRAISLDARRVLAPTDPRPP